MYRLQDLDLFQRIVLILLVVMVIVFAVLYSVQTSKVGFLYYDTLFIPTNENGTIIYSGIIGNVACSFTVTAEKAVTFCYGALTYGPFTAREDPSAVPNGKDHLKGVEILDGDNVYFRGTVTKTGDGSFALFNENGGIQLSIIPDGEGTVTINGEQIDPLKPSAATILQLILGPEMVRNGDWNGFIFGALYSVLTVVSILFADEIFRWKLSHRIQNADTADPSNFELFSRYLTWFILPVIIIGTYIHGLTQ